MEYPEGYEEDDIGDLILCPRCEELMIYSIFHNLCDDCEEELKQVEERMFGGLTK